MSLLDRFERKFGWLAIPGLIRYVVAFNALVFILHLISPGYLASLTLSPLRVSYGEFWRLFTWIFIPTTTRPLFLLLGLWFLWFLGDLIESSWGSFRLTLFYFTGWILCTLAALILPGAGGSPGANLFLNLSLLLAAATLQPDFEILLFFILPLKLKWLAWISLIAPFLGFIFTNPAGRGAIVLSLANYLLFFGPSYLRSRKQRIEVKARRARFDAAKTPTDTLHRCTVCNRTDQSHPDIEFRIARDGHEYCITHLPKGNEEEKI